jgi:hypothetical protein
LRARLLLSAHNPELRALRYLVSVTRLLSVVCRTVVVPQVEHSGNARKVWSLHHGRSRKTIVRVVPDADYSPLYRVLWSDIGLSPIANLTRCKAAALEWAERNAVTKHRNLSVAQRLKSLDNFLWSSSPMRRTDGGGQ